MTKSLQEVLIDNNVPKNALVVAVELFMSEQLNWNGCSTLLTISTVEAATLIHTVRASPEPPRYLRAMLQKLITIYS